MILSSTFALLLVSTISSGYHISSIPLNFNDALTYCRNTYNTSLATIYTPQQNTIVSQLCTSMNIKNCWIGLKYGNNWKWITNNISVGFTSWNTERINNNQYCTEMIVNDNTWNHTSCTSLKIPICNDLDLQDIRNGSIYNLYPIGGTNISTLNKTNAIYLNSNKNGTIINLSPYNEQNGRQKWKLKYLQKDINNNNIYNIKVFNDTDPNKQYLSVSMIDNTTTLKLVANDTGSGCEQWIFKPMDNYYYSIYPNINYSSFLSVEENGANIYLSPIDDGSGRQRWSLELVNISYDYVPSANELDVMDTYYLIPNELSWNKAEEYCQSHCYSHLASIHSHSDYLDMMNIINIYKLNNTNSIWFGLNNIGNGSTYNYADGTNYNYGTDYLQYPWNNNMVLNELNASNQCIQFDGNNKYEWSNDDCTASKRFFCNDCEWNIVPKYVMMNKPKNWSDAQIYCQDVFNTDLAMIYNDGNYNETELLMNIYDINSTWIHHDMNHSINNNNNDVYCDVFMGNNSNYIFDTDLCIEQKPFICNMPSELCYESRWNLLNGAWNWNDNDCTLDNINTGNMDNIQLDTFGVYEWKKMVIEYVYSIDNSINSESRAGITVNIYDYLVNENSPYSLFIGILYRKQMGVGRLVTYYNESSKYIQILTGFKLNTEYSLKIEINKTGKMEVILSGFNEEWYIDGNIKNVFELPMNWWINSIDIHTDGISSYSRSLYINGETAPYINTNAPTQEPTTLNPTYSPITTTTANPTTNTPTTDAPSTSIPTVNPTTDTPTTDNPTTAIPTANPVTSISTNNPTTSSPTTSEPTTMNPTTSIPTTTMPTNNPITSLPTTSIPTTMNPTTSIPTTTMPTNNPITSIPTTSIPTTMNPTTSIPTTAVPTNNPITSLPTTSIPTTNWPTSASPTTAIPTTIKPTTYTPTATNTASPKPEIIISTPSEIGRCDDLILDARSTTNLGGNDAVFEWYIADIDYTIYGALVTVSRYILSNNIFIKLKVTNSFGMSSSVNITVSKSVLEVIPAIKLNGIDKISSENIKLLNDKIDIYSSIKFENNCNDDIISIDSSNYDIHWFVNVESRNKNHATDTSILNSLQSFLSSQTGTDAISVDVSSYLQSGFIYTFIMNLKCIDLDNDCNVNSTHSVIYKQSDINVNIMGGDIELNNISLHDFGAYQLVLDGALFSYDPDNILSDSLRYKWQCIDSNDNNCDYLLESTSSAIVSASFDGLAVTKNTEYIFTFILEVYDVNNPDRDHVFDEMTLRFTVIDTNISSVIITTTAIKNEISIDDKVRIITDIDVFHGISDVQIVHKWSELNGLLTDDEIIEYSECDPDSLNLILKSNVLKEGNSYLFQLEVSQYRTNNILIAYGISTVITINVLSIPSIVEDSFNVESTETNIYSSINDYLSDSNGYSVSILAEGEEGPFLFQFMDKYRYLHPTLLTTSYLDNILLPIGSSQLIVNVYDSQLSKVSEIMQNEVVLESYSVCPDTNYLNIFTQTMSKYDRYLQILQRVMVYLQYLHDYYAEIDDIDVCLEKNLYSILTILNTEIGGDLCENNFVILLSQIMELWLKLVDMNHDLAIKIYSDTDISSIIHNITLLVLDPCTLIKNEIGYDKIEDLYTSKEAIITNTVGIYYDDKDMTVYLSPIITNDLYQNVLYSLIPSLIKSVDHFSNSDLSIINDIGLDIDNMLHSILQISTLLKMAKFIPGEYITVENDEFSIFAVRTSNQNLNITVHDISVNIPSDVLTLSNEGIFDSIDTTIVGFKGNEKSVVVSNDIQQNDVDYIISDESLSITITGDNIDTDDLASNIDFIFKCNNSDCTENQCVWYNQEDNIWDNSGCDTFIDDDNDDGGIKCSCSHLTTFAMIRMIKKDRLMMDDLFSSQLWDYMNWIFGSLFLMMSIYIFLQIYPFFLDKYLSIKQSSVIVMLLLCIISILYFVICIQFHFLKYDAENEWIDSAVNGELITFFLLLLRWIYFMVYSLIFNTWFTLAHSISKTQDSDRSKMRKILLIINIIIIIFLIIAYCLVIFTESVDSFFLYFEIFWSCILLIICILFIIYSFYVAKVLLLSVKISSGQNFAKNAKITTRRLLIINGCITFFFILQLLISAYFTISVHQFNITYRSIDLLLNLLFIILLCWMYREPMQKLVETEAAKTYSFKKYYRCCICLKCLEKIFILNNIDRRYSLSSFSRTATLTHRSHAFNNDVRIRDNSSTTDDNTTVNTSTTIQLATVHETRLTVLEEKGDNVMLPAMTVLMPKITDFDGNTNNKNSVILDDIIDELNENNSNLKRNKTASELIMDDIININEEEKEKNNDNNDIEIIFDEEKQDNNNNNEEIDDLQTPLLETPDENDEGNEYELINLHRNSENNKGSYNPNEFNKEKQENEQDEEDEDEIDVELVINDNVIKNNRNSFSNFTQTEIADLSQMVNDMD